MKKVLIIAYYWPPSGGSGVQRWLKMSKYLVRMGIDVTVYTPENPSDVPTDHSLEQEVPPEIKVIRRPITEPYKLYRRFISGRSDSGVRTTPINSSPKSAKEKFALWVRANLFIPDPKISWKRGSVRFLTKYLKEHPVDTLITTGPPQSMHLIGLELARRLPVRWVADFRDPWTRIHYFSFLPLTGFARRRHERLERLVLERADALVSVTDGICEDFRNQLGPERAGKVFKIYNGFDSEDFEKALQTAGPESSPENAVSRKRFVISHTGVFLSDYDPAVLWKALRELSDEDREGFGADLLLRLAGRTDKAVTDAIAAAGLPYEDLGYLPHVEAIRLQLASDVLLLSMHPSPEMKKVLTGKIFEYIATGRPIVSIGYKDSEIAALLKESSAGIVFGRDELPALKSHLKALYLDFRSGNEAPSVNLERLLNSPYSRENLTRQLLNHIL